MKLGGDGMDSTFSSRYVPTNPTSTMPLQAIIDSDDKEFNTIRKAQSKALGHPHVDTAEVSVVYEGEAGGIVGKGTDLNQFACFAAALWD
ncbi:hypothetical protein D9613_011928 [Agrocybe pediades]|uniref:Uncharacterized protein n=1 Tax=Agrocybe pediades TaxID=84607 RepID=A0A8H4QEP3_9AGAR|nr:hypothetical protein D9613_011928 [Agrocybe pediades]